MVKPEKRKKVQGFLEGKLRFDSNPDGKHESFSIPKKLAIHLPKQLPVNLQHGRGDVIPHIIRQIYQFLGLTYKEFVIGKNCNLSASVIYRALLWKHLQDFVSLYGENRSTYSAILEQYLVSSHASLDIVRTEFGIDQPNKYEQQIAMRISAQAESLSKKTNDFESVFEGKLSDFVNKLTKSFEENPS
ncbi:hypothetical protein IWQ54_002269 [Labrenzia sp. EL_195]|nr:hypothetical protein [Labrenzia sp. EL_195]